MIIESFNLSIPGEIDLTFLNYGGIIQSIKVPDRTGRMEDVVLGFDRREDYLCAHPYFGGIIGRYANRIKEASFEIDQRTYQLSKNEGENCLHGGKEGFNRKFWKVEKMSDESFRLSLISEHMDQGFPGKVSVQVNYSINSQRELIIEYEAISDQKTHINMTNHS